MLSGKALIIPLTFAFIKIYNLDIILHKMSQFFLNQYGCSIANLEDRLDLSNYTTKADLKEATGVDKSNLEEKSDLARD